MCEDLIEKLKTLTPEEVNKTLKFSDKSELTVINKKSLSEKNDKDEYRYYLEINLQTENQNKKTLYVIMMNPSQSQKNINKESTFIDKTITNLLEIINSHNYSENEKFNKLIVLNLIPRIEPQATTVKVSEFDNISKNFILNVIGNDKEVLLAWGEKFKNNKLAKKLILDLKERKNKLYTFCPAKKDFPKHPGRIDIDCCKNCYGRNGNIKLIMFQENNN